MNENSTNHTEDKTLPQGFLQKYVWGNKRFMKKGLPTLCFLAAAFFLGREMAGAVAENRLASKESVVQTWAGVRANVTDWQQSQTWGLLFTENWGLGFGKSGECPTGNSSAKELQKYNAYYVGDTKEKKIYLTFDCGYENGNTEAILEALKKHNVQATFFVVGHYLESAPELVQRMTQEGHTVGNHTYHHPDMSKISEQSAFQKEMDDVRKLYQKVTGEEMSMYYRPPQGKYSIDNLQMAKDLGYATFFWSLAYVDWKTDAQPTHEEALQKLTSRVHPGAIVLLHNTSQTNGEILDELLTKWEEMGYSFGTLDELISAPNPVY